MPVRTTAGFLLVALEIPSGFLVGSILSATLLTSVDPLIVFVIIVATAVAILDFADYIPAFSVAYFAGYIGTFFLPISSIYGGLKIPLLLLALAGIFVAVALKARRSR